MNQWYTKTYILQCMSFFNRKNKYLISLVVANVLMYISEGDLFRSQSNITSGVKYMHISNKLAYKMYVHSNVKYIFVKNSK